MENLIAPTHKITAWSNKANDESPICGADKNAPSVWCNRTTYTHAVTCPQCLVTLRADAATNCPTCDGYCLNASEAPYCPRCYRERSAK